MRTITIRQLSINLFKELEDLPVEVTRYGKVYCVITGPISQESQNGDKPVVTVSEVNDHEKHLELYLEAKKKFPESLKIMGGVFEGRFMSALEMLEIAQIPTLDVLRGKFVNIINSPIQRLVIGLSEISKKK